MPKLLESYGNRPPTLTSAAGQQWMVSTTTLLHLVAPVRQVGAEKWSLLVGAVRWWPTSISVGGL